MVEQRDETPALLSFFAMLLVLSHPVEHVSRVDHEVSHPAAVLRLPTDPGDEVAPEGGVGGRGQDVVQAGGVGEEASVDPRKATLDRVGAGRPGAEPGDQFGEVAWGVADHGAGPGSRPDASPLLAARLGLTLQSEDT